MRSAVFMLVVLLTACTALVPGLGTDAARLGGAEASRAVEAARDDWLAQRAPAEPRELYLAHCTRFERAVCSSLSGQPGAYECMYREWAPRPPWPRKRVVARRDGDAWRWVEGDPPSCNMTVFSSE